MTHMLSLFVIACITSSDLILQILCLHKHKSADASAA